ncbi:ISAzo13-like element transposase-related protein, partial [Streptomyces sp. NTH33]|uniref:ISAzo13-like element transposase-related protein n=1 Tax=Streptomyces sp. NTH33 TaxID=1735453 RepID=UPI003F8F6E63
NQLRRHPLGEHPQPHIIGQPHPRMHDLPNDRTTDPSRALLDYLKQRHWPGTSKWNKIEHRLFSHITMNWRGRPLTSHEVMIQTIAATTSRTGLTVHAELDSGEYPTGIRISDDEIAALPIARHRFHGDWNYTADGRGDDRQHTGRGPGGPTGPPHAAFTPGPTTDRDDPPATQRTH